MWNSVRKRARWFLFSYLPNDGSILNQNLLCSAIQYTKRLWLISDWRTSGVVHSVKWYFRTDVLGQPISPIFKDQAVQGFQSSWTAWPYNRWQIVCSETSIWKYNSALCKFPKERRYYLYHGGSLIWRRGVIGCVPESCSFLSDIFFPLMAGTLIVHHWTMRPIKVKR